VSGKRIRASFPKYTVDLNETEDFGPCTVTVKYAGGREQVIPALHLTLLDIFDVMSDVLEDFQEKEDRDELTKG
jgi:hypothetical protein